MVGNKKSYEIGAIAELTGMNPITLRAWEHRYGLVVPKRADNGRRVYSQEDLEKITKIIAWVKQGVPISKVKELLASNKKSKAQVGQRNDAGWLNYKKDMRKAIDEFNLQQLDDLYNELISIYPFYLILKNIIKPLLAELGEYWEKKNIGIANEHFFSHFLRNKVGARVLHLSATKNNKDTLLLACLPGEQHELGLLCFALHAMEDGFNCIMLGQNLPLNELERAIGVIKPVLSILYGCLSGDIISRCKAIIKNYHTRIAFVGRDDLDEFNFVEKNLYKFTDDFDFVIAAIRKILAYSK